MGNGTGLGKVRGLGSAGHGAKHWLLQRSTAVGNLLLTIWLAASLLLLPSLDFDTLRSWLSQPMNAVLMIALVLCSFWHIRLGMQVLLEDYLHDEGNRFGALMLLNFLLFIGGAMAILSVLRITLAGGLGGGAA